MARKPRDTGKPVVVAATPEKYDMVTSQRALIKNGFHPAVTSKSPSEIESEWGMKLRHLTQKPSKSEFEAYAPFRYLTTATLLFRYETKYADSKKGADSAHGNNSLAKILNTVDVGGEVADALFAQGLDTVLKAAITSTTSWLAMSNIARIWDFNASDFRTSGNSGVLLAVTPECTVGEMKMACDMDPYGLDPSNSISSWCGEALELEKEIFLSIFLLHGRVTGKMGRNKRCKNKQDTKKIMPVDFLANEIVDAVKGIRDVSTIWGAGQFVSSPQCRLFEPSAIFSVTRLRGLLKQISEQRNSFRVLHFQNIPFLDRRMVAIILRACPNVRMIGIYECPLIHFGDVLCLIDLVYEVNYERRKKKIPEITGFDFYPHYNKGTPFASPTTATYGLTWGPQKLDVVQRGFFNVIMKAFMKAKRMKLGLLFDKDKAFCKYLNHIPNYPLAVPTFLDAMYRYLEVKDEKVRKKVLYDLLKPVRLGVETHMEQDWPVWYTTVMGRSVVFCSSCGYETLEEFFSAHARQMPPHKRVCAGCTLQLWLDEEDDHLKAYKKQILDTLFPDWSGSGFNPDAPIPPSVKKIINLHSKESVRPEVKDILIDSNGEMYCPQIMAALVRDNKVHSDSLQNLPSLSDLLTGRDSMERWGHVYNKCNNLDIYCRSIRRVHEESNGKGDDDKAVLKGRVDGSMPDHIEELQPPKQAKYGVASNDFHAAVMFYQGLACMGWTGYN